jgi:hypothetical protein
MSKVELGSALVKTIDSVKIDREMQFSNSSDQYAYRNAYLVGYLVSMINHLTEENTEAAEIVKSRIAFIMSEV